MRWSHAIGSPLLLGVMLAACSVGGLTPPPVLDSADVPNLAVMSDKIQDVAKSVKLAGYARVSPVRRAPITALADWIVCLRSDAETDQRTYALFIQKNTVVDYRLALLIDQCAGETYGRLPTSMPIK